MWLVYTLLACLGFGAGAAMQKHGMATSLTSLKLRTLLAEPGRVMGSVLRSWSWMLGLAVNATGGVFMFLAIHHGEITVVQPLVTLNLLVAVLIGVLLLGERLGAREWLGGAILMAGAGLVGLSSAGFEVATPRLAALPLDQATQRVYAVVLLCALVVGLLLGPGRALPRLNREILFATCAGLLFGLVSVMIKVLGLRFGVFFEGPPPLRLNALLLGLALEPSFWLFLAINIAGFSLHQVAYANGRVAVVAPLATIMALFMPLMAGLYAFAEPAGLLRILGVLVIVGGVGLLMMGTGARQEA